MKTSVNIKMEESVKEQAKELFAQMGLDMTTAVNLFLIAAIREKRIPFEISAVDRKNEEERFASFLASKLRAAEEQEKASLWRDFDEFMTEAEKKYDK